LKSATETVNSTQTWKQTFQYDRFGNRRFDAANTTTLPQNNAIYNPNIDVNTNKLLLSEGYNYDFEGNLTSNPENQLFQYDADNRQTQVTNTASQTTANYFYDGSGKRARKLVGQEETIFVYDAFGKMVAEYATTIDNSRPKGTSYLTTDALGSPRIITDGGGFVISRHDYMPFGEEIAANIGGRLTTQGYAGNDGVRQQFTGYERDLESGLDYAQNRYFASKHGRFTSVDPLTASANMKNPQTFNRYSYAMNSPYKFTDPLGLAAHPADCNISGCDRTANSTFEQNNEGEEKETEFNRALTRYIFERLSQGYVDDSGGMTTSMYDQTYTAVVAQTVTLNYSVSQHLLTATRNIQTKVTTYDYNGRLKSTAIGSETETLQIQSSSGNGDCLNNSDCAVDAEEYKNTGPIPIGDWVLNKNNLAMLDEGAKSYLRSAGKTVRDWTGIQYTYADYGSFRVALTPVGTSFSHREGFFLHGGAYEGSRGCIDVGGGLEGNAETKKLISWIRSNSFSKIALTVTK
jgi:RHS repeat-associated protein